MELSEENLVPSQILTNFHLEISNSVYWSEEKVFNFEKFQKSHFFFYFLNKLALYKI